jgi:putative CocE/NonD family hydrolase
MRFAYATPLLLFFIPALAQAQKPEDEIKERYTKYEYRIPMRDGAKLFTAVYVPKEQSQKFPILMMRTPYSCAPYGIDRYPDHLGPSGYFWREGYILVNQDVRGRWMSEGEYVNMRPHNPAKGPKDIDEASDTYDTIEWLVHHVPNNNGRVGQWGISYPGFYTAAGMIDAHPALKAVSPQAPINDWFMGDDWHHNGALMLPHCFNFLANFGKPRPEPEKKFSHIRFDHETPDGYEFFLNIGPLANADKKYFKGQVSFWNEVMQHPNYDEFWAARNLRPHLKGIRPAVMTVGGWFDAENLFGALETYRNVEKRKMGECRNSLVMGPWNHGGWSHGDGGDRLGDVRFNAKTSKFFQEKIELPFFEYHLKGKGDGKYPQAWVFETGTNVWRQYDTWPPKNAQARTLYFHEAGKLSAQPPASGDPKHGFDEYVSDPAKPVPYYEHVSIGMAPEYMVGDQRQMGRRPDVMVYETDVLTEDTTLVGPIEAMLHVSTSGTDSDWIVKLIDVYPTDLPDSDPKGPNRGAYQQLIRGDVFRGRFRNSFEKPEAMAPNEPTSIEFRLQDICHTFRPGHRIMIQVQSTWFPLVDRNPQTFVENIALAKESDFQKATQRVYRTKALASGVQVLVMP